MRGWLQSCWWDGRHRWLLAALVPLSLLYRLLFLLHRQAALAGLRRESRPPLSVPVVVVGNRVVGGAGKTPVTIALVESLLAAGWSPGVVSRGYGSRHAHARPVSSTSPAAEVGDEPLLIARRTGQPVWVGHDRLAVARALCRAQPQVDVIVCDDGLQHVRLPRQVEVIVFDSRGVGNGWVLPAGPLREPLAAHPPPNAVVLYNAVRASTPWPGHLLQRRLAGALPLADWWSGRTPDAVWLREWAGREVQAAAGIGEPERFFRMLEAAGLRVQRYPLPDHHAWQEVPQGPGNVPLLVTEKDAVKIPAGHPQSARILVVTLDCEWPAEALRQVCDRLRAPAIVSTASP